MVMSVVECRTKSWSKESFGIMVGVSEEWGVGNGEWRMGNGEWGMGNREWEIGKYFTK